MKILNFLLLLFHVKFSDDPNQFVKWLKKEGVEGYKDIPNYANVIHCDLDDEVDDSKENMCHRKLKVKVYEGEMSPG